VLLRDMADPEHVKSYWLALRKGERYGGSANGGGGGAKPAKPDLSNLDFGNGG
jgi:hypothetical protein